MRRAQSLGPAEHALLGLLQVRPRHGYELAELFAPTGELGDVFRLHMSLLYTHLKRLEGLGYIEGTLVPQGARPPRTVYRITPAGEAELRRWLDAPVAHNRDVRIEFLLKLYLSRQLPEHDTAALVERQLAAARSWVAGLEREIAALPPGSYRLMVREMRLAATRATIAWLERTLDRHEQLLLAPAGPGAARAPSAPPGTVGGAATTPADNTEVVACG